MAIDADKGYSQQESSAAANGGEIITAEEKTGNQTTVQDSSAAPNSNLTACEGGETPAADVIAYFRSFARGYHFVPTDEELIRGYLMKKINNEQLPPNLIRVVNVYSQHPSQLATREYRYNPEKEWYFFTSRDKKYPKGWRPSRRIVNGVGYWKPVGAAKPIPENNVVETIGYKRSLDFYEGLYPSDTRTVWKMYEYTVKDSITNSQIKPRTKMTLDNWVLCKIYVGRRTKAKGGGSNTEVDDDDDDDDDDDQCWNGVSLMEGNNKTVPESQNSSNAASDPQVVNEGITPRMPQQGTKLRLVSGEFKIPPQSSSMVINNANNLNASSHWQVVNEAITPRSPQQGSSNLRLVSEEFKIPPQSSSSVVINNANNLNPSSHWQVVNGVISQMPQQGIDPRVLARSRQNTLPELISTESDVLRQQSSTVFENHNPLLGIQNPYQGVNGAPFVDRNYNIGSSQYQVPYASFSSSSSSQQDANGAYGINNNIASQYHQHWNALPSQQAANGAYFRDGNNKTVSRFQHLNPSRFHPYVNRASATDRLGNASAFQSWIPSPMHLVSYCQFPMMQLEPNGGSICPANESGPRHFQQVDNGAFSMPGNNDNNVGQVQHCWSATTGNRGI